MNTVRNVQVHYEELTDLELCPYFTVYRLVLYRSM